MSCLSLHFFRPVKPCLAMTWTLSIIKHAIRDSHFDSFESILYSTSGSVPLSIPQLHDTGPIFSNTGTGTFQYLGGTQKVYEQGLQ